MDEQYYQGYPVWRKQDYAEQHEIVAGLLTQSEVEAYNNGEFAEKVQFWINKLYNDSLTEIKQLALLTKIRQEIAKKDMSSEKIAAMVNRTNILDLISQVLLKPDNEGQSHLVRYMKLESSWILTNIGFGHEGDILKVFDEKYQLPLIINRILKGNDLQMID